uniref:C4 protein n=1 Tax=Xenopus laevis TaxID=8355 RepID=B7ZS74_XENLA|nr:C4 protein [Xenopus laevis]
MGPPPLLYALVWAAVCMVAKAQQPNFLVVAPRILHVGVKEVIGIQFEWPQGSLPPAGDIKVELSLRNQLSMIGCSGEEKLFLNKRNDYTILTNLMLTSQQLITCKLNERRSGRYVQLVVKSDVLGKQPKVVSIPVAYQRGYLFIQTDKSIYTPKETVHIRSFTLDHVLRPTEEQVTLSVFNAQGFQVRKVEKISKDSVVADNLQIPDISTPGVWRISAHYTDAPETNFTAEFEVKPYVLPNFEVKIIPEVPYFLMTKDSFTFRVEARYVYGEHVAGVAYMRVGITAQNGKRYMLRGLEKQTTLIDGDTTVTIRMADIKEKIQQDMGNLLGTSLYFASSVVEKASGVLEEKEFTSVKFVSSPYKLDLSKTKRYFIPGTPAQIVVEVSHIDGSPAAGVSVSLSKSNAQLFEYKTDNNGVVAFHVNTASDEKKCDIRVKANSDSGSETESITLLPYTSKASSYLFLNVPNQVLDPGSSFKVTLKAIISNKQNVEKIYYMVLNKGQLLSLDSIRRTEVNEMLITVKPSMIPSFRVIAYYYLGSEIISNSVWVDVADVCEGKLELHASKKILAPGEALKLDVRTEGTATVSLSAVDTAVYILNSKNKLTPQKMFKAMNAYDLGCSPGGGKDFINVFTDAGLAFVSSAGYSQINELGCRVHQRKKRAIDFQALTQQKAYSYTTTELQRCCQHGMMLPPGKMSRVCTKRAARVPDPTCRKAFLDCCEYAENLRKQITLEKRKTQGFGRTQNVDGFDEDFADESDIQIRSFFPETWLWRTVKVYNGLFSEAVYMPDSITTWEIQAIGMSREKGFCIAEPLKVKVFKDFHIYLRVPYSVKRFEQMELRPILYNYNNEDLEVKVYMEQAEDICSPGSGDSKPLIKEVTVGANSALPVPFVVVPIGKSNPVVSVVALGRSFVSDGVKKAMKIVKEGASVFEEKSYIIDPADITRRSIDFDEEFPSNMIPDGDFRSSIKVTMDSSMNTINNSLGADGISKLIRVPYGCAEQTMISTSPGVYALRYLDHTEKWNLLSPDRKDEGLENMRQGYLRILQFKKADGSYGAWLHRTSSTWLTAFVVKVLSLCRNYIDVNVEDIRLSAQYLATMQKDTGAFQEKVSVIHQDMLGGSSTIDAEVSITAFVTVSLYHSLDSLSEDNVAVKSKISKAVDYLRAKLDTIKHPYSLALTTYALTLTSKDSVLKDKAYNKLMSHAQGDPNKKELYFGPKGTALAVETTSYVLLITLLRGNIKDAEKMYTWLSEQQNYGGGFKSTQDTVMALEALSEYWIRTFKQDDNALEIEVNSLEKQHSQKFKLRKEDNLQEELRSMGTKFNIKVSGKGKGILTVIKMYNILQMQNTSCTELGLDVTVSDACEEAGTNEDDDYDYDEEMADEPREPIVWHDLRRRSRREATFTKEKEVKLLYEVCLWKKSSNVRLSGMAIVDITLLSGIEPVIDDLKKLAESSERYISHYEYQPGRLLLYFDKVPDTWDCVAFEAVQTVKVSLLQPASAVIYDFYEPNIKCTVFYGAPSKPNFVSTLCSGDVCQCAEGLCPKKISSFKSTETERQTFACYSPRVVFGYRVMVENIAEQDAFIVYTARILEVLQRNSDEDIKAEDTRLFYQRMSCKMRLAKETEYLIMGQDGVTKNEHGHIRYILDKNFWVEELPGEQKCAATRYRNFCTDARNFMDKYKENGCMV